MKNLNKQTFNRAALVSFVYTIFLTGLYHMWRWDTFDLQLFILYEDQQLFILLAICLSVVWIVLMIIIAKLHSAAYEYYIINPPEQKPEQKPGKQEK